ncbi:Zn-dependent hydrolase [Cohnella abietis]|uniref:Zn-dependent hydrolase n=1 Tax=Cohnella abietis TaxID=2507935 RepID=A0A3T1DB32_9BACL|nr:Zn-dependent hydrolase [Cohnella abietis]
MEARINRERLWHTLSELGLIGRSPTGGINRLSLDAQDLLARSHVHALMLEAGLSVRQDEAGNLIGRLEGDCIDAPAVITGSHIDTVTEAGKFDGALGVLAGIEVLRTVKELGVKHHCPLEVICFTDEEGVRFGIGYLGSRAMAGEWSPEWLKAKDKDGISLNEAMIQADIDPSLAERAARPAGSIRAYLELHIEQGRVLEDANLPCGLATAIYGYRWLLVKFKGHADHAGTTPMALRRDALLAAAEAVIAIEKLAIRSGGTATVGTLKLSPGAVNVIPDEVIFTIDYRHSSIQALTEMGQQMETTLESLAFRRGLTVEVSETDGATPVTCSEQLTSMLTEVCGSIGIKAMPMVCGAGHDAVAIHSLTEIGLILVRSKDGISHHREEWSSLEDCSDGADILLHSMLRVAQKVLK